ncbi:LysR family transcriptional regulator [Salsipaludibacter albus]|uniref:LysR family transcriptional regulator n=1 Tax=Salsipaludibacter albus TaxID=2849650 RepID=UPI001EE3B553|nr:LysR family transcriptional regulator [Salsipaludibacter albus]MBY5162604.1 LysR family transcriptional regulator [Salsipaludibacter albus]
MIDPRRLRFLVEVDHWGTVTAAAESLGYSPSAASQQLAALQRDLDVELLVRDGRNVRLTRAGRALVDAADGVFDALETAETATRRAAAASTGVVRVGALGSTIVDLVPLAVASLERDEPELGLEVVDLGDAVLDALRNRRIDLAVDHHWSNVPDRAIDGLSVIELCREPVYVVTREDVDLTDPQVRAEGAWIDHPCVQCGPATRAVIASLGAEDPRMQFTTDDMTVMLHVAALGSAMTVVPGLACLHLPDGVRAWRVPGVDRQIGAFVRDVGVGDPGLEAVASHLAAAGASLEDRFATIDATLLTLPT